MKLLRILLKAIISTSLIIVSCSLALAKEITVVQKGKKFDKKKIKAKIGDTLVFKNDDPFQHNVYSLSPGNTFELKTQDPGKSSPIELKVGKFKGGEMKVECAIHPKMKLVVEVEKAGDDKGKGKAKDKKAKQKPKKG